MKCSEWSALADGGAWSVTICAGLKANEKEEYRKTGYTIHLQHRVYLATSEATVIHRKSLTSNEADKFILGKHLLDIFTLEETDFELDHSQTKDAPIYLFERINKSGYNLVVRRFGDVAEPEVKGVAKDIHAFAHDYFREDLMRLAEKH